MSTATAEKRKTEYDVQIGQRVLWYPAGKRSEEPATAFVTKVGDNGCLTVALLVRQSAYLIEKYVVWHIDSEIVRTKPQCCVNAGAWDYHPLELRSSELQALRELAGTETKKTEKAKG